MLLRFTKMHGLGNDFVLLDLISQGIHVRPDQIRALADRRLGIGFDQLLTVEPPTVPDADFLYRIYNADGSEAEQCGNGARCFLRFVRDRGLTTKTDVALQTTNGIIHCRLERDGNITVDLGPPVLAPERVPFVADKARIVYEIDVPATLCGDHSKVCAGVVNMGNPHAVIRVSDVDNAPVQALGAAIESHERFPDRVNVGFMQVMSRDRIRLRVFERGVGETRACGSGAAAAMVAGRLQGLLDEEVTVELTGGTLKLAWQGDDASVMMTGPAARVYEGRLQI